MTGRVSRALRADAPLRLFIALWPSAAAARQLAAVTDALHASCGGRRIPRENLHMTLAFLGSVMPGRVGGVEAAMRNVTGSGFELELDAVEYRKRGGLWWMRATHLAPNLERLVQCLRELLHASGLCIEHRRFVPHITLLRDARPCATGQPPMQVIWPAGEVTLVCSHLDRRGARYEVIHRVALKRTGST